jgi:hypothetical protein
VKRTQITKRIRRFLAVAGASTVLAAMPATAALAGFPDETTQSEFHGCQYLAPREHKACEEYSDQVSASVSGQISASDEVTVTKSSGSDPWPNAEYLWIAASIAGVAGATVAFLHRRHPPLVS